MLVDSHCHLDFPELAANVTELLANMKANAVTHALCVSVNLGEWPRVMALAEAHDNLYASVGVHPDQAADTALTESDLLERAANKKIVAIGETGLDYYRLQGDLEWQRQRFRTHIRAARACGKPLIVHTRAAREDTLAVMREQGAGAVGGVMHCFTETWDMARAALEMNFYISFSGIVTFKNAAELREIAKRVPLDRMLVETDSPYLAPVPFRGKVNQPAYVKHVAEEIARIKGLSLDEVGAATSRNFFSLFGIAP